MGIAAGRSVNKSRVEVPGFFVARRPAGSAFCFRISESIRPPVGCRGKYLGFGPVFPLQQKPAFDWCYHWCANHERTRIFFSCGWVGRGESTT